MERSSRLLAAPLALILLLTIAWPARAGDQSPSRAGDWYEVRRREGVLIELRETPGVRTPESRGVAILPFNIELLKEILLELEGYGRRWPYVGRVDVLWRNHRS